MLVFDASSMIYAWDNYPSSQLPGLWKWMATKVEQEDRVLPTIAFEQVVNKAPDCGEWLKANNLVRLEITNAILQDAMRIKGLIGVVDDNYHSKGVDESDLLIIAVARAHNVELVSNEEKQISLPIVLSKYKIPAVCDMNGVAVPCINFLEYIKRSQEV